MKKPRANNGKRVLLSKEEVREAIKNNADFQKRMKFVKEVFYPAILDTDESIEDALQFLSGFSSAIMQEFLERMKDVQTKDLNLVAKIVETAPEHKKLVSLFDGMSAMEARTHAEQMKQEIELFMLDEKRSRKLSTLKPKWADEI